MKIGERFIGRDREAAQLDLAIGPGNDGLRLAMLSGPSGLGKTTLSGIVAGRVAERGFRVTVANGRAGSLSTPFAPWIEAFPGFEQVLESLASRNLAGDMEQIGIALVALLAEQTATTPLLLVFDDAQALDESSLALLPYAAGVSERMNITLLLVEQSDAVDIPASYRSLVDGLMARRVVQHLELGPMSDESVGELVRHVLDLDEDAEVPTEIVLRAQGNPWFAKELAEAYQRGETEIPVSIAAAATARLLRLADNAQDVVYSIALCPEGAYIGWLEGIAGERPRHFARTMEAITDSGLIREDGDIVSIAHPLMRQALLDELSAAMKRALHLELAEVIAETPMSEITGARAQGFHLSSAGKPDEAVSHYLRAAEANEILGQLHEAVADYVRALEAEPRIENRTDLLKRCAYAATQIGSDRACGYWTDLGRVAAAKNDNDLYAYALFQQYWASYDGTALDRLDRAAALGPDEFGWSARAKACLLTLAGEYKGAIDHDTRALELARASDDRILETLALEKLGLAYAYVGRLDDAIEASREAVTLATANRLHSWAWIAWNALSENLAENLETERSTAEARSSLKYVEDLNLVRYRPVVQASVARALLRAGKLEEAREVIDAAVTSDNQLASNQYSAIVLWSRAKVWNDLGDVTVAQVAIDQALHAAQQHGFASWIFETRFEQARFLALSGNIDGAIEVARSLSIDEPVAMAGLALWLVRVGIAHGADAAIEFGRTVRAGVEGVLPPLAELMLQEIDVTIEAAKSSKVEALQHVSRRWDEAGRALDALRVLTSVGVIMVRAGQSQEAIAVLTGARARFAEIGATADADFVSRQLRGLGTRSRAKSRSTTVGNLTKRELQIARLVASGLRNAEVAGQLFLAEKTVAAHLSNIYGKLEVRSRVQLAAWLKENDAESVVA